ncbi:resolvase [Lacticaseibacillus paracasei subsp. paracasei Lpp221]|jgi:DNA invertase Pin-like site-specific DNA recombinase|uniref:recombinase family protein n=1 Tax=Lacticaseibacillus paracasei TaxID=1597 RepID=UPI000343B8CD|nr:recombinase family protein [Lacticaseibacillus paracasei]EPC78303.1 resolvase [Lacticaseibacillus paracasei subsp. paracasei Lpp221]
MTHFGEKQSNDIQEPIRYGYARVSTLGQSLDDQIAQLKTAGVRSENLFAEKYTGTTVQRPKFDKLIELADQGDVIIVTKLDRLARNTKEALTVLDDLQDRGISVDVLNLGRFATNEQGELTAIARLMRTMLLAFAEMERDMIVERTQAGKAYAKKHNPNFKEGRPLARMTPQKRHAYALLRGTSGERRHTYTEVAKLTGYSKSTIQRIAKRIESEEMFKQRSEQE